jgi:hypothetical protein
MALGWALISGATSLGEAPNKSDVYVTYHLKMPRKSGLPEQSSRISFMGCIVRDTTRRKKDLRYLADRVARPSKITLV